VKKIPADAIYLDIDYQDKNKPFTVNRTESSIWPRFAVKVSGIWPYVESDAASSRDPEKLPSVRRIAKNGRNPRQRRRAAAVLHT